MQRIVRIRKPVQRQNARRHITRIAAAYRRHHPKTSNCVLARSEVLGAFAAHMVASRRALLARAEA